MSRPERWLKLLLRIGAIVLLGATFAIVLPVNWMRTANDSLGLAPFPDTPLVSYLTRSLAALYAYHGLMIWIVTTDLKRYAPMIRTLGWGDMAFGIIVLGIDSLAGMPWYWTASEGPSLIFFGVVILSLLRRCEREWVGGVG